MRGLLIFATALVLAACAKTITFTNFESGEILQGRYQSNRTVTVTMPDGEILSGRYSALSNATASFGSGFGMAGTTPISGTTTAVSAGGTSQAYALLTSATSDLAMEVIVNYSEWNGQGFGEARTNDGRTYRVQF